MTTTSEGYWSTAWSLSAAGGEARPRARWALDGVTFDRAIAFGIERATRVLSGLE